MFSFKKIKLIHYDIALIIILFLVVINLIKSEDSYLIPNSSLSNSTNNNTNNNKKNNNNQDYILSQESNYLNYINNELNSNIIINENNNKNNNYIKNIKINQKNKIIDNNNYYLIQRVKNEMSEIQKDQILDEDNSLISAIEKSSDIKEKRLGSFKKRILKIPLAFVQILAVSIALLCLLIP